MAKYFSLYPKAIFDKRVATDLLVRTKIKETWLGDPSIYYQYLYKDGDRPEHIAQKYYGDENLHWIIMFTNNAFNPYFDFPLNYENFNRYINDKYKDQGEANDMTGLEYAQLTPDPVFRYQKIVRLFNSDGTVIQTPYVIDKKTYHNIPVEPNSSVVKNERNETITYQLSRRVPEVTIYERENEVNEDKRLIKLLRKNFVQQAKTELLNLLK